MRRSFPLMLSALLGAAYLVYFGVNLYQVLDGAFTWNARIGVGSHVFTMPYLIIHAALALVAVLLSLIAYGRNSRGCALMGGVLYTVSAALMWYNAPFLIVQIILDFVGFSHLKHIRIQLSKEDFGEIKAEPRIKRPEDEDPRASDGLTRVMTGLVFVVLLSVLSLLTFGTSRLPDVDQIVRDWMGVEAPDLTAPDDTTPTDDFGNEDDLGLFDDGEGEEFFPDEGEEGEGEYDGALDDYGEPDASLDDIGSGGVYG